MAYRVEYTLQARKSLKAMPLATRALVMNKIAALAADPRASNPNIKKLTGCPEYRLRVGDWRVLYLLHHDVLIVEVLKIGPRGGFYA